MARSGTARDNDRQTQYLRKTMTTYAYQLNGLDRFLQIRPGLLAAAFRHVVLIMRIRR